MPKQRLAQNRTLVEWVDRVHTMYQNVSIGIANASGPVLAAAASAAAGRGPDRVLLLSTHVVLNNTDALGCVLRTCTEFDSRFSSKSRDDPPSP